MSRIMKAISPPLAALAEESHKSTSVGEIDRIRKPIFLVANMCNYCRIHRISAGLSFQEFPADRVRHLAQDGSFPLREVCAACSSGIKNQSRRCSANWRVSCCRCPTGEVYSACRGHCQMTCDNREEPATCATDVCVPACVCAEGLLRGRTDHACPRKHAQLHLRQLRAKRMPATSTVGRLLEENLMVCATTATAPAIDEKTTEQP
ncbi:hypothetical protein HNY73_013766 [Argiope bruennichi]|uniref:TIL domain-containing protein n=1 Tax=Argiope bruennichi TaxID=94029 RepID=A0A8T0ELN8_ARGBR|nr:hypothetical protein HNY73_013766 [Argiope bruennichi]